MHFCIFVLANTNQTICVQELDLTSETVNLKVSLTIQLEQLIMLDCNNGLMSRLLMSLTLLYKKVEVLENEVMGLTLPLLFAYIYVTYIFPMEASWKVHLQFIHSSVESDFGGARRQSK